MYVYSSHLIAVSEVFPKRVQPLPNVNRPSHRSTMKNSVLCFMSLSQLAAMMIQKVSNRLLYLYLSANSMPVQSIADRMYEYEHHHGRLPHPTVAQLLEADRPFRMAWAETCDKLRKADADLRRMQRVRQATAEMLEVLDTLIASCL